MFNNSRLTPNPSPGERGASSTRFHLIPNPHKASYNYVQLYSTVKLLVKD